ncbi:MAG: hypothetical protein HRJ53_07515 [Acidobacteria bacterium Pan2503]|uniref:Uncharacterized protein n=1 Tax=Candidatus Acidiferrum panamense TaxID=2741543 RepID=A0A7V8SWF3_9BACT|nr:hypothetical protein [Candidatus Acidoferrum panamensis]
MSDMIWLGGVAFTLFFVVLSITAVRWWPLIYVCAVGIGAGAGLLLWDFPPSFREAWWLAWMLYIFSLPLGKTIAERRRISRRL